jgi:hypothetical protein
VEHVSRATAVMVTMLEKISSLNEGEGGSVVLASCLLMILVSLVAILAFSFLLETIAALWSQRLRCLARVPEHVSPRRKMAEF